MHTFGDINMFSWVCPVFEGVFMAGEADACCSLIKSDKPKLTALGNRSVPVLASFWPSSKLTCSLILAVSSVSVHVVQCLLGVSADRSCDSQSMCFHTRAALWSCRVSCLTDGPGGIRLCLLWAVNVIQHRVLLEFRKGSSVFLELCQQQRTNYKIENIPQTPSCPGIIWFSLLTANQLFDLADELFTCFTKHFYCLSCYVEQSPESVKRLILLADRLLFGFRQFVSADTVCQIIELSVECLTLLKLHFFYIAGREWRPKKLLELKRLLMEASQLQVEVREHQLWSNSHEFSSLLDFMLFSIEVEEKCLVFRKCIVYKDSGEGGCSAQRISAQTALSQD